MRMRTLRVRAARPLALLGATLGLSALLLGGSPASAFDFFDGRVEVHGFYEVQLRSMARDLSTSDDIDLTQWYNVLNIEVEADLAPDGFGPFDIVQAFVRVEGRYDCVWNRGCGTLSSADAFGDRADASPERLDDARRAGFRASGTVFNGDTRFFRNIPRALLDFRFVNTPPFRGRPSELFTIQGLDTLFDTAGQDEIFGNEDDPAPFFFSKQLARECNFNFRKIRGLFNGITNQILGPWGPECTIEPLGALSTKPHPLSALDVDAGLAAPVLFPGQAVAPPQPFRPVPLNRADMPASLAEPRGIYYPNAALANLIRRGEFDAFDQNFRQAELEWNHGASQQDEKELKEAYLDLELFDSRLWLRVGKQQIVWGKTELFRNQDLWNPQDLALASLPSLEESRIGLWAIRGVWSFYEVGPFEDVRLELAALWDQFEPTDLGRCGEPYTPNPVCAKTLGLFIHGLTGFGVAGEIRPQDPWNSSSGLEVGGRLEWRWERFSFALTNYYGFTDLPFQDEIFRYSRNVDPLTGRPRRTLEEGPCTTGAEPACLTAADSLTQHHANQQLFHMICSTSIGLNGLDRSACGQSVFNSLNNILTQVPAADPTTEPTAAAFVSNLIAANDTAEGVAPALTGGVALPLVDLVADPSDAGAFGSHAFFAIGGDTLNTLLTDEQEALLGCGPFYDVDCELNGIDLMNAEASALLQSFPGFDGSFGVFDLLWDTTDGSVAQPGTFGFDGGVPCSRFFEGELIQLPGCRGPGPDLVAGTLDDDGVAAFLATGNAAVLYDVNVDGSTGGAVHPFTGQAFRNELAILSWNALMGLVALSSPEDPMNPAITEFDEMGVAGGALRTDGCSFAVPNLCANVQSIFQVTGAQRNTVSAGGNGRFGRRDWVWHGGRNVALRYEKRNVLGFSMDFAEDRTKSNWGVEFTWQEDLPFADNDAPDGITDGVDTFNLTVSVDRPTFINFLNANRTFFINSQIFMRYVDGYQKNFQTNGPWTFLGVLVIETGYFDDRLIPRMTFVYDKRSNSGAFIPQFTYKFTADFVANFGLALFAGRMEGRDMPFSPNLLEARVGRFGYKNFVENGLSAVRDRDEVFLRLRYTF